MKPYNVLKGLAVTMLIGGIILLIMSIYAIWDLSISKDVAGAMKDYAAYAKSSKKIADWNLNRILAVAISINSVIVYCLSFIVEAACKYIELQDKDE